MREFERAGAFGPEFVAARGVHRNNDRRAALKRRINELIGALFVEEKSYPLEATRSDPAGVPDAVPINTSPANS